MTHFTRREHVARVVELAKGDTKEPMTIRKSLYDVGRLASILADLAYLRDNCKRDDAKSAVTNKLQKAVDGLADALKEMAAEEASHAVDPKDKEASDTLGCAVSGYYSY